MGVGVSELNIMFLREEAMIPKDTHEVLEPIYKYIREIKEKEPERAKQIAKICLELNIAIKKLDET